MYALHGEKAIVAWSLVGQVIAVVSTIVVLHIILDHGLEFG